MGRSQRRALRSSSQTTPRASRHAKPAMSYLDPSGSEVEKSDAEWPPEVEDTPRKGVTKKRSIESHSRAQISPSKRRVLPSNSPAPSDSSEILYEERKRKKRPTAYNRPIATKRELLKRRNSQPDIHSLGIIPPWSSLPYQILVQIFHYASYPLYDERTFQASTSVNWLVKTARLCRGFTEPALTILYRSPPLVPMDRAHMLRQLLMADPEPMSYNYRAKVERLQMEVSQTAAYTLPRYGLLDLHGLISNCPRLLDLELYHQKDMSPYRSLDESIKWTYPDSLFYALERNVAGVPTRLRSWRWSSRLAGKKRPIEKLLEIHQSQRFSGLRKIAFVNYQKPIVKKNTIDPQHEKALAASLTALVDLEHLIIESSTLANSTLLPLLPMNLKHLELINCWEVTSDDLSGFLVSHGSQLRSLTLNHNQSLNLSFLMVLGRACRHLESLKMNLTYYNVHSSYRDSTPEYEKLIGLDQKPDWPASLQSIELTQLRNWDIETAKMFFQSLLSSASMLLSLRRLIIKAILNTSWRDRSSFRDEWVGAFERVFKRPLILPNSHLQSLGAHAAHKAQNGRNNLKLLDDSQKHQSPSAIGKMLDIDAGTNKVVQSVKPEPTRRSQRTSKGRNYQDPNSDSDDEPLVLRVRNQPPSPKPVESIQGMCDVVSITIDNLRPTETQFVEADFLDSEPEGDEDWNGTDVQGGGGYAW